MADFFAILSRNTSKFCFRAPEATFWFQVLTGGQFLLLRRMRKLPAGSPTSTPTLPVIQAAVVTMGTY